MSNVTFIVGDIVSYVYGGNGTGEGILWKVKKVTPNRYGWQHLWISPCFTITGPSVRSSKKVHSHDVTKMTAFMLLEQCRRLNELAQRQLAHECGVVVDEAVNVK